MKKIGFIGSGNMAKAMIGAVVASSAVKKSLIFSSEIDQSKLDEIGKTYGINVTTSNIDLVKNCDVIFLCIKPHIYKKVIIEIKEFVTKEKVIVTIAPGQTLDIVQSYFESPTKIIRTMPNTPCLVGEGMTGVCYNKFVTNAELTYVLSLLESFGKWELVSEKLLDTVVAVSGSSPAYVYMFIEALADGAVRNGMNRDTAYKFAAQAVLGSAKMVLETGKHPGELKDMVCSPGGTTIEAVASLEKTGFRSSIIEAMEACIKKIQKI